MAGRTLRVTESLSEQRPAAPSFRDEHGTRSLTLPEALMPACLAAIAPQL
jgi:hypothetical protein